MGGTPLDSALAPRDTGNGAARAAAKEGVLMRAAALCDREVSLWGQHGNIGGRHSFLGDAIFW